MSAARYGCAHVILGEDGFFVGGKALGTPENCYRKLCYQMGISVMMTERRRRNVNLPPPGHLGPAIVA